MTNGERKHTTKHIFESNTYLQKRSWKGRNRVIIKYKKLCMMFRNERQKLKHINLLKSISIAWKTSVATRSLKNCRRHSPLIMSEMVSYLRKHIKHNPRKLKNIMYRLLYTQRILFAVNTKTDKKTSQWSMQFLAVFIKNAYICI